MVKLQVKVLDPECTPKKGNEHAAGLDMRSSKEVEFINGEIHIVPLGVIVKAPEGYYTELVVRSGLAAKGFDIVNSPGIIDRDYCGPEDEVKAILRFTTPDGGTVNPIIRKGDRIAQLLLKKQEEYEIDYNYEPEGTDSRGGFGSTGKQ